MADGAVPINYTEAIKEWRAAIESSIATIKHTDTHIPMSGSFIGALQAYLKGVGYRKFFLYIAKGRNTIVISEAKGKCEQIQAILTDLALPAVTDIEIRQRPEAKNGYRMFIRLRHRPRG